MVVILYSCTGKQGDPGAAGPAGANGKNGVANIIVDTITEFPNNWNQVGNIWTSGLITCNAITNSVFNNGMVEGFTDGSTLFYPPITWASLPYSYGKQYTDFLCYVGSFAFNYGNSDSTAPAQAPQAQNFKIVIIPPAAMKQHPKTNWKDWSQVNAIIETQKALSN